MDISQTPAGLHVQVKLGDCQVLEDRKVETYDVLIGE